MLKCNVRPFDGIWFSMPASTIVVLGNLAHRWALLCALLGSNGTACMEATTSRRVYGRWRITLENDAITFLLNVWIRKRNSREKSLGLRMIRFGIKSEVVGVLNEGSQVHDGYFGRDMLHDRKIMRDKKISGTKLFLQTRKKIENLCLDRDIKS